MRAGLRKERGTDDKLWTSDGDNELGEFKLGPLTEDGRWNDKFVHKNPGYCWKATLTTSCNHRNHHENGLTLDFSSTPTLRHTYRTPYRPDIFP